ncbi:MAG: hypothetical protein GX458_14385 [Phyllobacteriaceae bacterium]|nr:hypothetical protein [Phyllobacteriaceae bacterium]
MTPRPKSATAAAPLLLAVAGGLLIVLLRGAVPFPLVSDHAYFLPASWWMAETGHLANPWMQGGFDRTFDWHGFLQPWLIGALARPLGGGWDGVRLALDLLAATTVVATALYARALGLSPLRAAAVVAVAIALMLDARSRPEVLATLETGAIVVLCVDLARRFPAAPARSALVGALLATLACTHPAAAVLVGFSLAAFLATLAIDRRPPLAVLAARIAAAAAGFVCTFAALVGLVFHGDAATWLAGIAEAGRITMARTDTTGLARYFLADRFLPGFGLFASVVIAGVWATSLPAPDATSPMRLAWAGLIGLVGALLLHRTAVRIPATYYNLTSVSIAASLVVAAPGRSRLRRLTDPAVFALGLAALAGIAVWTAQALVDRPRIAVSRADLAAAVAADLAAGRSVCAAAAALAAVDRPDLARRIAVSLRLAEAPAAPDPATCDVYYALRSADAAATPPPGFVVAQTSTIWTDVFSRLGLRPSHFGFARWVSQTRGVPTAMPNAP